ncbi:transposase [Sorangium sp. So ce1099]|uniref:transposase n=1 Tax=Sorangium sp. So ce1099 TaxID=3133331 RepID=UPI003F5F33E1
MSRRWRAPSSAGAFRSLTCCRPTGEPHATVETRTPCVITVRGILRACGHKLATCNDRGLSRAAKRGRHAGRDPSAGRALGDRAGGAQPRSRLVNAALEQLCAHEPVIARLTTAPGVELIVAAAFVSVVDEAKRSRHAHQLASYLGLVPLEGPPAGATSGSWARSASKATPTCSRC